MGARLEARPVLLRDVEIGRDGVCADVVHRGHELEALSLDGVAAAADHDLDQAGVGVALLIVPEPAPHRLGGEDARPVGEEDLVVDGNHVGALRKGAAEHEEPRPCGGGHGLGDPRLALGLVADAHCALDAPHLGPRVAGEALRDAPLNGEAGAGIALVMHLGAEDEDAPGPGLPDAPEDVRRDVRAAAHPGAVQAEALQVALAAPLRVRVAVHLEVDVQRRGEAVVAGRPGGEAHKGELGRPVAAVAEVVKFVGLVDEERRVRGEGDLVLPLEALEALEARHDHKALLQRLAAALGFRAHFADARGQAGGADEALDLGEVGMPQVHV